MILTKEYVHVTFDPKVIRKKHIFVANSQSHNAKSIHFYFTKYINNYKYLIFICVI